jgi:hypothetical protein
LRSFYFAATKCPKSTEPLGEFEYLADQKVLPNGTITNVNSFTPGTDKRVRVKISGTSGKIISGQARVSCEYSINQNSSLAMNNTQNATLVNFDPTDNINENDPITFFAQIPTSNLASCQWFHYRWVITFNNGINAGRVRTFQIGHHVDSENPPSPCPQVP